MKSLVEHLLLAAVVGLLVAAPAARVPAQDNDLQRLKPVAVVSVTNLQEMLADVDYLSQVGGAPEIGGMVKLMAPGFTAGIDKTRPIGAYVTVDETMQPKVIAFVPVTNVKMLLDTFRDQLGTPKDLGNGIMEIGAERPQPVYLKEQAGWAFISNEAANLAELPQDPASLLTGLDQQYNICVRTYMQNIPAELKQVATSEIRAGFEGSLEQDERLSGPQQEVAEKLARNSLKSLMAWIEESDELTIGWAVDSAAKTTYLDFSITAMEGTSLARRMATQQEQTQSAFAGFLLPDAATTLHFSSTLAKEDIEQLSLLLQTFRDEALAEIQKDAQLTPEKRMAAADVLKTLLGSVQATVEGGRLDGGAALLLEPDALTFVAGGLVADGQALENAFKKLVEIAKEEPDFPEVTLDADNHAGVRFHTLVFPIPAEDQEVVRQLLGEELDVALGIGPQSVYLAFGRDPIDTIKRVIDQSAADAEKGLPSSQLNIALTPILKFAATMDENPLVGMLAGTLEKSAGRDRISIINKPIERGGLLRLTVEEGVLQAIGQAAKMAAAGAGAGPGARPGPGF